MHLLAGAVRFGSFRIGHLIYDNRIIDIWLARDILVALAYYVMTTLSTVGYGNIHPINNYGYCCNGHDDFAGTTVRLRTCNLREHNYGVLYERFSSARLSDHVGAAQRFLTGVIARFVENRTALD